MWTDNQQCITLTSLFCQSMINSWESATDKRSTSVIRNFTGLFYHNRYQRNGNLTFSTAPMVNYMPMFQYSNTHKRYIHPYMHGLHLAAGCRGNFSLSRNHFTLAFSLKPSGSSTFVDTDVFRSLTKFYTVCVLKGNYGSTQNTERRPVEYGQTTHIRTC